LCECDEVRAEAWQPELREGRRSAHLGDDRNVLVIVGGEGGGRWLGGFQRQLGAPFRSMGRKQKLIGLMYRETQDLLLGLTELIEAGNVVPVIDRTYPFSQAADAIRYLEQGHAAGKLVLTVP
jgi:NADPH:quinone reductase-like Zn-dependent oxidoreductase